jgi:hypothetical protein
MKLIKKIEKVGNYQVFKNVIVYYLENLWQSQYITKFGEEKLTKLENNNLTINIINSFLYKRGNNNSLSRLEVNNNKIVNICSLAEAENIRFFGKVKKYQIEQKLNNEQTLILLYMKMDFIINYFLIFETNSPAFLSKQAKNFGILILSSTEIKLILLIPKGIPLMTKIAPPK